jgi:endonuclease/exonuclease/phosphatase family metal-dependent hydrolase
MANQYPLSKLRVVVWNMAGKQHAWAALDRLEADICLLNEAVVPSDRRGVWSADGTLGRDNKRRRWTTAVVSRSAATAITDATPTWRQSTRNVPFHCSRPGSWAAARVDTALGAVSAVGLYGLMDELSDASVHRSLSELSPVMDDPKYSRQVILGGDLNTGTQWPAGDAFNRRDRNVLDRIEAFGLVDCIRAKRAEGRLAGCPCSDGEHCRHVRTRRDALHPSIPYQTDYLFASPKLAAGLVSCEVLATDEWFAISDHAPIMAEFEL